MFIFINMFQHVLLALVYQFLLSDAKIHISVKAASKKQDVIVNFKGVENKTITNMDVKLFNISNDNLNKGIEIELGKVPDDIFLNDPTRYGDLYRKYKWIPVTRRLRVRNVEIVDVINDNIVLKTHEHINNTTRTITTNVSIYETVESEITSFWSKQGLPIDYSVYNIDYNFTGRTVSFLNRWRGENFRSATMAFGITKSGYINIKSGQKVTRELKGKKTIILIKIHYVAELIGNVVINYAHYGNYHFWAPYITDIMKAAGIVNGIVTTELIEVRCYTDPVLDIFDSSNGEPIRIVSPFHIRTRSRHSKKLG